MIPYNADLEKTVLGCLMLGKQDYITKLTEQDFYNSVTLLIYKAIKYLTDKKETIDAIKVSDILNKRLDNALEIIISISDLVPTPENIETYVKELKGYTARREIIKACDIAKQMAMEGEHENPVELKNNVLQKFDISVYETDKKSGSLENIMLNVLTDIEEKHKAKDEEKLFTRFHDLDRLIAGLHPEELTLIAARPGVGKTAFVIQMMLNMAKRGVKCLMVSREMSQTQVGKRILSNLAVVDGHKLRLCKALKDEDWEKIGSAVGEINELPVEINDTLASVQEIRSFCRDLKNKDKLDVLIVDYLQLCKSMKKTESRRHEVEDISRQFKEMSLEFKIPVVVLSQLSRESADKGEPELHHLRESGSLEQDKEIA